MTSSSKICWMNSWAFSRTTPSRPSHIAVVDSVSGPAISFLMRRRSFPPGLNPGFAG